MRTALRMRLVAPSATLGMAAKAADLRRQGKAILDLSAGELLTQLFQTRRMLLKSEQRIAELEETLGSIKVRRTELEKARMTTLHRCAELVNMCQGGLKMQNDMTTTLNRMIALIAEEQQR